MRGTLIALRTGGAMAQGGGAPAVIRVVPVDAFSAYVIAPHDELGAVAWELVYGNGDDPVDQAPADSIGAPFGGWRLAGVRTLPDVMANPETEVTEIIYSGIGSQGVAINVAVGAGTSYAGDYHAGKSNSVQTGSDPTSAAMLALFEMVENYTINWPDDGEGPRIGSVTSSLVIDGTGSLTNSNHFIGAFDTLTAALSLLMVESDFTRASVDQGESWTDISADGSYAPVATKATPGTNEIWFRRPLTGTIIKAIDNAQTASNFKEKYWDRNSDRVKLRNRFDTPDGGDFGDETCVVTYSLAASAPDPVPTWSPFTDSFDASNPGEAGTPLGWDRVSAPAPNSTIAGGNWTVVGNGSIQRFVRDAPLPPGTYHLEVDYSTAGAYNAGGVKIAISPDGSGTGAIVPTSSFNSPDLTTKTIDFVVPTGQLAYVCFEASLTVDRAWTARELRMTGTPD